MTNESLDLDAILTRANLTRANLATGGHMDEAFISADEDVPALIDEVRRQQVTYCHIRGCAERATLAVGLYIKAGEALVPTCEKHGACLLPDHGLMSIQGGSWVKCHGETGGSR